MPFRQTTKGSLLYLSKSLRPYLQGFMAFPSFSLIGGPHFQPLSSALARLTPSWSPDDFVNTNLHPPQGV